MGKVAYRVRNWTNYNQALINRGNLTVWISEDVDKTWYAKMEGSRGRPKIYSDSCIGLMLTIRSLFRLPLRASQGFFEGFLKQLGLPLKTPNYTRLSRRSKDLDVQYHSDKAKNQPRDLVVDSTGLKIYGEGEWKVRVHGKAGRRTWRKLHLALDPDSFETVSIQLTHSKIHDDSVMTPLLKGKKRIGRVYADGAYISGPCFDAIASTGAIPVISVRTGTGLVLKNATAGQELRNELVMDIWRKGGREKWKKESGYHRRSLVETQMYRFKTIMGPRLASREFSNQVCEAKTKTMILNKMTALGMPKSHKVG
jgi:hypothetical protein